MHPCVILYVASIIIFCPMVNLTFTASSVPTILLEGPQPPPSSLPLGKNAHEMASASASLAQGPVSALQESEKSLIYRRQFRTPIPHPLKFTKFGRFVGFPRNIPCSLPGLHFTIFFQQIILFAFLASWISTSNSGQLYCAIFENHTSLLWAK